MPRISKKELMETRVYCDIMDICHGQSIDPILKIGRLMELGYVLKYTPVPFGSIGNVTWLGDKWAVQVSHTPAFRGFKAIVVVLTPDGKKIKTDD